MATSLTLRAGSTMVVTMPSTASRPAPTTLRLSPALKARVAALAEDSGKTVHAFLVELIEQQTDQADRRRQFVADALAAKEQLLRDGKGYPANAVHEWLRARAAGKNPPLPKKVAWRK